MKKSDHYLVHGGTEFTTCVSDNTNIFISKNNSITRQVNLNSGIEVQI